MTDQNPVLPQPPAWLNEVCQLLARQEPELWEWFAAEDQLARHEESVHLDLLKSAVRLQRHSHADLYAAADQAAEALQLDVPVTLYQSRQTGEVNASISADAVSAHIVFQGDLIERLSGPELQAVLGHELGHVVLWRLNEGVFLQALRVLNGLCNDPGAHSVYPETIRLFGLYMEVFCDRCALVAQGQFDPVVASLIKIETGLHEANVSDYVGQAEEIRQAGGDYHDPHRNLTHPELYIRTSALGLWHDDPANCESEVANLIEGDISLDQLNLVQQRSISSWTRELIAQVLAPQWMRCEATLAHARLFFPEYEFEESNSAGDWSPGFRQIGAELASSCFVYVLLDFVTADRDLQEPALALTMQLADQMGVIDQYAEIVRRELRLRKKQLEQIRNQSEKLMQQASQRPGKLSVPESGGSAG